MGQSFDRVHASAAHLAAWSNGAPPPDLCIVLGSGLADAVPAIDAMAAIAYRDIPGFALTSVSGHKSELRLGDVVFTQQDGTRLSRRVAFLRGRAHAYEGYTAADVVHAVRSVVTWGARGVILTNAAGCLEGAWALGRLMLITDHINATGLNPISGEAGSGFSPRFLDMTQCYDAQWQDVFRARAAALNETLHEGVYYGVLGPTYETPAEIRMMKTLGASAVGMSTVLEAIAARQLGARVAGVSCLTNYGAGLLSKDVLDHSHVVQMGHQFARGMADLVLSTACLLPL